MRTRIGAGRLRLAIGPAGALAVLLAGGAPSAADEPFELVSIPSLGRTVAAEFGDFDGDGRTDLLEIAFQGVPPDEQRWIRLYRQGERGDLPLSPSGQWPVPEGSAAYDVADIDGRGGVELLLLRREGVLVLGLDDEEPTLRTLGVPGVSTLAAAADERGLDRLQIAWPSFGAEPWILLPLPGESLLLGPDGAVRARLETGARANYLIPQRDAPVTFEGEMQLFLDAPRLHVGDVDGDGRPDVVATSRHALRVFLQKADRSFPHRPDRILPLRRLSAADHVRASGSVRALLRDLNQDGRLDLVLSQSSGSFTKARARTTLHLNRAGSWNLDEPDQVFESEGSFVSTQLVDLDGDGRLELMHVEIPLTVLELVEVLVTRAVDANVSVYRPVPDAGFASKPWFTRKLGVPLDFETTRPRGFIPNVEADLNGDGRRDLLASAAGDAIEIFLGSDEDGYRSRAVRQSLPTAGRIRFGHWRGGARTDFLIYAPRLPDAPLRVGLNQGRLPGSPPEPPVLRSPDPTPAVAAPAQ